MSSGRVLISRNHRWVQLAQQHLFPECRRRRLMGTLVKEGYVGGLGLG